MSFSVLILRFVPNFELGLQRTELRYVAEISHCYLLKTFYYQCKIAGKSMDHIAFYEHGNKTKPARPGPTRQTLQSGLGRHLPSSGWLSTRIEEDAEDYIWKIVTKQHYGKFPLMGVTTACFKFALRKCTNTSVEQLDNISA